MSAVNSEYLTDKEYQTYWFKMEGVRKHISQALGLNPEMRILDVGTGQGLFALEMAKQVKSGKIIGIDISDNGLKKAKKLIKDNAVSDIVSFVKMDAVKLSFSDNLFDVATSFLGMRDIYMTRGRKGIKKAVKEMIRVVRPNGKIVLCITPPEDMDTEDQRIAVKLEGEIFGAKSLPKKFYVDIFKESHVVLNQTRAYLTHKKMTADQTKTEFKDGLEIARKIYGKKVPSFREVWEKYGKKIETLGYGMYSKIVVLVAQKFKRDMVPV